MEHIIEARNIFKSYKPTGGKETQALNNVSMSIKQGEYIAVMGPSGSGKSTLLYSLGCMDNIDAGNIDFAGQKLEELDHRSAAKLRLHNMGFVFQHMHLLKNLNIRENILVPAMLAKKRNKKEIIEYGEKLMALTGISRIAESEINQVSGGQMQRAAICRALINKPDILFGDEPTGALDSRSAGEVMDLISEFNRIGTTVVLVTHDVKVAARAQRVLFMSDGQIREEQCFSGMENDDRKREEILNRILLDIYEYC